MKQQFTDTELSAIETLASLFFAHAVESASGQK